MSPPMADIRVERKHALGKQAAHAAALKVAERLKEKAQIEYRVSGDTIEFERTGAKGRLVIGEDSVVAEISIGFMLRPMRGMIENKIDEYFERYLK